MEEKEVENRFIRCVGCKYWDWNRYHSDWVAGLFDVDHRCGRHVLFRRIAFPESQRAAAMGARNDLHAAVFTIGGVDGQPGADGAGGGQRPVCHILMPGDPLRIAASLQKK